MESNLLPVSRVDGVPPPNAWRNIKCLISLNFNCYSTPLIKGILTVRWWFNVKSWIEFLWSCVIYDWEWKGKSFFFLLGGGTWFSSCFCHKVFMIVFLICLINGRCCFFLLFSRWTYSGMLQFLWSITLTKSAPKALKLITWTLEVV